MSDVTRAARRPRADAARNRAAILDAARTAFTAAGEDASLEAIARSAGVGIGTLYRNFPTREELVAAVYASELDAVLATVPDLLARHTPDAALRAFLDTYAGFIATKRGMAESVRAGAIRSAAESADTRRRVNEAVGLILAAGAEQGVFREGMAADDVTAAMIGVFLTTANSADPGQTGRLLDLLVRGLAAGE
ncbi:TetR/AcrR family transcriptional regulator [Leifsonia sp. C5G2]|uniref:TetR/AcrR family transcriptional regulator n=1 Tax=Leifsonia sp. C5G2 TaxID=2735269 RepID=UPI00158457A5|nr:TetR/AcrR family transcriptional regulator [Leifsonia sp. C5G2]NUU05940.1 helix-turn-helix transcriptional regulator [Leifsonia sp. C5G2]